MAYHQRRRSPNLLHVKAVSLAVAACFSVSVPTAYANPNGFAVVNGQATFNYNGNTLSITNTPGSIINWQGFSIGANELTRFIQQSAASSVLNRVVGAADPSRILGALQSNGRVFLINPSGILFGAGAQVDVAGLVASTLNLSNADFLAGRFRFTEVPGAGSVVNQGSITTPAGGQVYLIAPNVQNSGIITSPRGEVILAAGRSVELVEAGTPGLRVELIAPDNEAVNVGQIMAASGKVGIYAGLIRAGGAIRADGVVAGENGEILLKATQSATVDAGATISASGAQGGKVTIQSGDTTLVSGTVEAKGSEGKGGTVQLLGHLVGVLDGAVVDASGQAGGGTVLVGGDYQGRNPDVQNAYRTYLGPTAAIKADAIASGDGGKVIVWSDDATRVYGSISARGGAQSGDGGFVETSGHALDVTRGPDVSAPRGTGGTWLLDPDDLNVVAGGSVVNNTGAPFFSPLAESSSVGVNLINAQLDFGSNVVLTTTSQGPLDGTQAGNITVSAPILKKASGTGNGTTIPFPFLTLQAHNNIVIDGAGSITSTGDPLDVTLAANNFSGIGTGGVTVGGAITTNGGFVDISGRGPIAVNAPISTLRNTGTGSGNSISLSSSANAVNVAAAISSGTSFSAKGFTGVSISGPGVTSLSSVDLSSSTGPVTVTAPVSGSGGSFSASAGGGNTLTLAAPVTSAGASLTADDMDIQAALNAGAGGISVQQNTAGRAMNLGTNTAGALSLTQAELSNLVTSGGFTFGNGSPGAFTVSTPVTVAGSSVSSVSMSSGTSFTVSPGASLTTAASLDVLAPAITVGGPVNAQSVFLLTDNLNLGPGGMVTSLGNIDLVPGLFLSFLPVNLGVLAHGVGSFDLTSGEVNKFVTGASGALRIGSTRSDLLTIQGAIQPTGTQTLVLSSGNGITQAGGPTPGTITVTNLALNVGFGNVNLPQANVVTTLAAQLCCSGNSFTFNNKPVTPLTIGTVDGIPGITDNFNGVSTVNITADNLDVTSQILIPFGTVNIMPTGTGVTLDLGGADVTGARLGISQADLDKISANTLTLKADRADISASVGSPGTTLVIAPLTPSRPLNIVSGAKDPLSGNLEFLPAELLNVTAGSFTLGDANTGPVAVNAATTIPPGVGTFTLRSGVPAGITFSTDDTISLSATGNLAFFGDTMNVNASVTSTGGNISIAPNTAGKNIFLGTKPGGATLGLLQGELNKLSAPSGTLFFGNAVSGSLTVPLSAPVTFANSIFLTGTDFIVGDTVTTTGTGSIDVSKPSGTFTLGGAAGILTNAEFDLFRPASGVLHIGDLTNTTANSIQFVGAVNLPVTSGSATTLSVRTANGSVTQTAGTLSVQNLAVRATTGITLTQDNNVSGTVALNTTGGAINFKQVGGALNVGAVDDLTGGLAGVRTSNGQITLQTDLLNVNAGISAAFGSNNVSLLPVTATQPINLGVAVKSGGALELTNAELNLIDAATLFVGNTAPGTGTITVAGPVNLSSSTAPTSLQLLTAAGNSIIVSGALAVPNGNLTLNTGTLTTTAAVSAGGSITATAAGTMNLGANVTAGSNIFLTANTLTAGANVASSFGAITGVADSMTFSGGAGTVSAGSTITLRPINAPTIMNLGGAVADGPGLLSLESTDLAALSAPNLVFGGSSVPSITVSGAATDFGSRNATLITKSGGTINVNAGLTTTGNVTMTTDDIAILAGVSGGNVTISTANPTAAVDLRALGSPPFVGLDQGELNFVTTLGTFTINAGSLNVSDSVTFTNAAKLTLHADQMTVPNTVTVPSGGRIIVAPRNSRAMDLGGADSGTTLGLTSGEINNFVTTGVLQLGDTTASSINISQAIAPSGVSTVTLFAGNGGISQTAPITETNLRIQTSGQANLTQDNSVTTLAGSSSGNFSFTNSGALTIGTVDGQNGISDSTVTLRSDTLTISPTANPFTINASTVILAPRVAGSPIDLGSKPPGVFGITDAEMDMISASNLTFGTNTTGFVNVSAPMSRTSGTLNIIGGSTNVGARVSTGSGNVTITSDSMNLAAPITSPGTVTLTTLTAGRPIELGTENPAALSLTAAEINQVNASSLTSSLIIGSSASGSLNVSAPIAPAGGTTSTSLTLRSGGAITQNPGATIVTKKQNGTTVTGSLNVSSTNGQVNLPEANDVGVSLSGNSSGIASDFVFNNVGPLKLQNLFGVFATGKILINAGFFEVPPESGFDESLQSSLIAALDRSTDFTAFDKDKKEDEKKSDEKQISKGLNAMCRP